MDHVAFGMPVLVYAIPEDFDELLQNSCLTAGASLRELGRVVVVTVDFSSVLIVAILCAEDRRTDGASKMLDVVLSV